MQLRQNVGVRPAAAVVLATSGVQLVVHARRAVRARKRAAALCGHVDGTAGLVEQVARHERQAVEWREWGAQLRPAPRVPFPDVRDVVRACAGFQGLDQVEHRLFALAQAHVVEAWAGEDDFWRKGGVQPAGDDGYVELLTDDLHQVPCAEPLTRGQRDTEDVGPRGGDVVDDIRVRGLEVGAHEPDVVAVGAQVRADERRPNGGHRPRALRVDFEEDDSHGRWATSVRPIFLAPSRSLR